MTSNLAKSTIAALLAGTVSTAAIAGSTGLEAGADVEAGVSGTMETAQSATDQVDNAVTSTAEEVQDSTAEVADTMEGGASADAEVNYGTVISGLNTGSTAAAATEIEALGEDVTVDTVLLSEVEGDAQGNALDNAIDKQADAMASFHEAIEANADLTAALEEEGFAAEDVVGFESEGEGEVTLVIDDRA